MEHKEMADRLSPGREYRDEFLEWIEHPPPKFIVPFIIKDYIEKKLDEERNE